MFMSINQVAPSLSDVLYETNCPDVGNNFKNDPTIRFRPKKFILTNVDFFPITRRLLQEVLIIKHNNGKKEFTRLFQAINRGDFGSVF